MRLIDKQVDKAYSEIKKLYEEGKLGEESLKKLLSKHMWEMYSHAFGISYNVWKKRNGYNKGNN